MRGKDTYSYAMLDFGFKAKPAKISIAVFFCYAMLDFGFKAKLGGIQLYELISYAMLDFGFKAKRNRFSTSLR